MLLPPEYESVDHARVRVRSADREWLAALGLTSLDAAFELPAQTRGRYKALARLEAPDGRRVFVKRYDFNRHEVWVRCALKLNFPVFSGPVELENLLALAGAGLRVPLPLAAGEADDGPRRRSFVACLELAGQPLDTLPVPATPGARRDRVAAVADLTRRLHEAGFWHRDLYLCNLFWSESSGLGLLDCERVKHRAGGPRLRWRVKDLAALDYSTSWATRSERLRGLLRYLDRERLAPDHKRLALTIRRKARRLAAHGEKT